MTYSYSLPNVVSNWARPLCPGLHSSVQFLCLSSLPITLTSISMVYFLWKPGIRRKNLFNILPLTYVRSLENYHDTLKVQTTASLIQTLHSHWTLPKKFSKCQIKTIVSSSWDLLKEYWSKGTTNKTLDQNLMDWISAGQRRYQFSSGRATRRSDFRNVFLRQKKTMCTTVKLVSGRGRMNASEPQWSK